MTAWRSRNCSAAFSFPTIPKQIGMMFTWETLFFCLFFFFFLEKDATRDKRHVGTFVWSRVSRLFWFMWWCDESLKETTEVGMEKTWMDYSTAATPPFLAGEGPSTGDVTPGLRQMSQYSGNSDNTTGSWTGAMRHLTKPCGQSRRAGSVCFWGVL